MSRPERMKCAQDSGETRQAASRRGRARWALVAALVTTTLAGGGHAQSAADKATARELAQQGVKLYGAGEYEQALDRLTRAEELYDAPVHVLYIARSSEKLGRLVEAAEAYRRLVRTPLSDGAPEVFRAAVRDGKSELDLLEPRIPRLVIEVTPAELAGLVVTLDGVTVSRAALGVERLSNPGLRRITAEAPGYTPVVRDLELAEGQLETADLELVASPEGAGTDAVAAAEAPTLDEPSAAERGSMGFVAGVRLGGFVRFGDGGNLGPDAAGGERSVNDYFPSGGGLEGMVGFRFARYYSVRLVANVFGLGVGDALEDEGRNTLASREFSNSASSVSAGVAVALGTDPRKFGGFGELALLPLHNVRLSQELRQGEQACSSETTFAGGGLRLGGGLYVPLSDFFTLTPQVSVTLGTTTSIQTGAPSGDLCGALAGTPAEGGWPGSFAPDSEVTGSFGNHQVFLGVGGDFLLGEHLFR